MDFSLVVTILPKKINWSLAINLNKSLEGQVK